ncbi:MAG TPA: hypothetical protein DEF34_10275 [Desulfotomaculum sp.]|nr:MAG: hypothetical protein JL56_05780 [Desulfotomaculum sp. BICA1-6]HBX24000.1 hypothetical protein [Desulfotomaculum sp.]
MHITELQEFMRANNLKIDLVQAWDNDEETAYTYQGYRGDKLIFDMNEFNVKKAVRLDVMGADIWDVIEFMRHADWIYDMFLRDVIKPLERYVEGMRLFKEALNTYGPPVLWIYHNGALISIDTDAAYDTGKEFEFYLADQKVATIRKYAIVTPSNQGRPANLLSECKASFSVRDEHDFIMDVYWPAA